MMSPISPHVTLAQRSASSGRSPYHPTQNDRERSRNAKAQARHRAKRKAYVEQLEQTVTKLQAALGVTEDTNGSSSSLASSPLDRIRELEDENARLSQQIEDLRRQLGDRNASQQQFLRPDIGRRTSASDFSTNPGPSSSGDHNSCNYNNDRDNNLWDRSRFTTVDNNDRDYMLRPAPLSRNTVPPLQIPSVSPQTYQHPSTHPNSHPNSAPRSLYHQNPSIAYASPLSTSSASSSPSYSQQQHSPHVSRPPQHASNYSIKVEDDYLPAPTLHGNQYPYTPNEPVHIGATPWAYPTERTEHAHHLH